MPGPSQGQALCQVCPILLRCPATWRFAFLFAPVGSLCVRDVMARGV